MCVTTYYLVRHGMPAGNFDKTYLGHSDISLAAEGYLQAGALAEYFANLAADRSIGGFDRVFSSDLRRAADTAKPIAKSLGLELVATPELREINVGVWDGLSFSDVRRLYPEECAFRNNNLIQHIPPNGESLENYYNKTMYAWKKLRALTSCMSSVIIVTHSGLIRSLLCGLFSIPLEKSFTFKPDYGSVSVIKCFDNKTKLLSFNNNIFGGIRHES